MHKKQLIVAILLCSLLLGLSLSFPALAAEKTVLTVWDWWDKAGVSKTYFEWVEKEFEKRNPDIDVQYQTFGWGEFMDKLVASVATGNGPDASQLSVIWGRDLYEKGLLYELDDFVARNPSIQEDQWVPNALKFTTKNGHWFALPFIMDSAALVYNKDHFESAGLDPGPFSLESWDDFLSAARKLTKRDGDKISRSGYYGSTSVEEFMAWFYADGGKWWNDNLSRVEFDSPQGLETLEWLRDIRINYPILDPNARDFAGGTASMRHMGTWSGPSITSQDPSIRFGITSFPQGPSSDSRGTVGWTNMMAVFKDSKHPEEALRYVKFVTSLETQLQLMKLKDVGTSPRLDFFKTDEFRAQMEKKP